MGIVQDPAQYQQQTFAQFYQEQPAYAPQVRAHFLTRFVDCASLST